ncbi:hypothetical protein [Streptomyces sp. IBSBF 2435]|uniref:hypothetical protein n=1 Tax=Streptomyces sp. IBSBF 2435 TaxID=2903531 RepID=UPI002FDC766C
MITPDNLAARFAPPITSGPLYARQVEIADSAYMLAESVLDALPRGHHLDRAVEALETAVHQVWAGLNAVFADTAANDLADPVPSVLSPGPAAAATAGAALGDLALNVSLYRTCVRTSRLFPIARLAALTLADLADEHGYIADRDQPSVDELCAGTGCGPQDVLAAIEELAVGGWIGRLNCGDGAPTRYQLRTPATPAR